MSDRLVTKTRQQLVDMIVAHSRELLCVFCKKSIGKLIVIPCDVRADEDSVFGACLNCSNEYILKIKPSFLERVRRVIEAAKGRAKENE